MVRTLELPMLSLAMPNIHKLDSITTDSLSCMWTVFSKCKENLENGRRLENLSWRLWYRESVVANDRPCSVNEPTTPIDEQEFALPSPASTVGPSIPIDPKPLKHVSPTSFKRMLTYLGSPTHQTQPQPPTTFLPLSLTPPTNCISSAPIIKPTSLPSRPTQRNSKFFILSNEDSEDEDSFEAEKSDADIDEDNEDVWQDDDECVTVSDDCESAYQREFKKQIVRSDRPSCPSLLSRLLVSQCTTTRPIRITATLVKPSDSTSNSISDSLRDCIDWEHRQNNFNAILNSPSTTSYSESFQWW